MTTMFPIYHIEPGAGIALQVEANQTGTIQTKMMAANYLQYPLTMLSWAKSQTRKSLTRGTCPSWYTGTTLQSGLTQALCNPKVLSMNLM